MSLWCCVRACSKVHGGNLLNEEVHPDLGVLDLKALIEDTTGIAVEEQRIMHKGRALHDADTLENAGEETKGTLHSNVNCNA